MVVLVVVKHNNGVGATTLAVELAKALLPRRQTVYLVDADAAHPALSLRYYPEDACGWLSEALGRAVCGCRQADPVSLEYVLVGGMDAATHYHTGCAGRGPVALTLGRALAAYLDRFEGKGVHVVVDAGNLPPAVLDLLRQHFIVYIDDARLNRPTQAQMEVAARARVVVCSRCAEAPRWAQYAAPRREGLQRAAREIVSLAA